MCLCFISPMYPNPSESITVSYNKTTIALDYDGTVTSDPQAFTQLINLFRQRGHLVYIVTMRYLSECQRDPQFMRIAELCDGIIPTDRKAKREACLAAGITPHIWIDDNPAAVDKSATDIWGSASPEGEIVIEVHDNN